ncbi:MAG: hypothetical protein Q9164_003521 [Protoblastenia rupestris]
MVNTNYDDSGQVYTETTCASGPMPADWVWKTRGSTSEHSRYRSRGRGCSCLFNMAIRSVLTNSYTLAAESLEGLPWELGRKLWQRIVRSQLDSVKVWKAFVLAYPNVTEETLRRKRKVIMDPNMPLASYIEAVTSSNFQWLTFLNLQHITCPRTALVHISRLTNLAVLTIGEGVRAPEIGVDDGIIRIWGRIAATDPSAFTLLRVLSLILVPHATARVFNYLDGFPVLGILNVDVSSDEIEFRLAAESQGWRRVTDKKVSLDINSRVMVAEGESILHATFELAGEYGKELSKQEGVESVESLPRLHLALGGDPRYSVVGVEGQRLMRCFCRTTPRRVKDVRDPFSAGGKRPVPEPTSPVRNNAVAKRRKVKVSKQQDMAELLLGFGS